MRGGGCGCLFCLDLQPCATRPYPISRQPFNLDNAGFFHGPEFPITRQEHAMVLLRGDDSERIGEGRSHVP
jgi:hypothetical protein